MALRILRVWVAAVLACSGALMYAASWQRWATGLCAEGAATCEFRQDHRFDFLPPADPWEPAGRAAELGGMSLLVLALVVPLLPWALAGRRPGPFSALALIASELALVAVGVGTYRSGLSRVVVEPWIGDWSVGVWVLVLPILIIRFAVAARAWARAASVLLVLSMPVVAAFSYAVGPYDAQPWWEGVSGILVAGAALCLLASAVGRRTRPVEQDASLESAVLT
jgi:hypothetical protein